VDGQLTSPAEGSVKGGLRRRLARLAGNRDLVLTATDQILSSTSNFVLGVLIGRLAGPGAFGAYILAFTVWLVVVGIHRALVTEPIVISRALDGDRQSVLRRGFEADLLLAGGLGVVVALGGAILALAGSGDIGVSLIVLAFVLPVLVAQDYWRAMAFALHRPGVALANDAIFVAVQVAALATVLLLGARTAPLFLLAWGAGAAAGAVAGFVQFGVHPFRKGAGPLYSHNWPFSRWLLADFLTIFCADQTYLLLVAALLGQAAFGELKAALSLMGPTAVILLTGGNLGLPTLSRARANDGIDGLVRVARKLTKLVGAAVLIYCAVVLVAGPWLLSFVYGPEFASAGNLARIGAVQYAVAVAAFGAGIAIRVARQARTMWISRLLVTALSIVAVIALSSWFGVVGAAWAGVLTVAAATAATLLVFRAYVTSERASQRASEGAGTSTATPLALPPPALGTRCPAPVPASTDGLPWPPPALAGHGPG
jgi:O-antigen/teichoic acid export membrane protein